MTKSTPRQGVASWTCLPDGISTVPSSYFPYDCVNTNNGGKGLNPSKRSHDFYFLGYLPEDSWSRKPKMKRGG